MRLIQIVELAYLKPGMVLGADVTDFRGHCLLREGTELNPVSIAKLERLGVLTVQVVRDVEAAPEQVEALRNNVTKRVGHLFRHASRHQPLMVALARVVLEHRLRGLE